jgi:hypothetical protein
LQKQVLHYKNEAEFLDRKLKESVTLLEEAARTFADPNAAPTPTPIKIDTAELDFLKVGFL